MSEVSASVAYPSRERGIEMTPFWKVVRNNTVVQVVAFVGVKWPGESRFKWRNVAGYPTDD